MPIVITVRGESIKGIGFYDFVALMRRSVSSFLFRQIAALKSLWQQIHQFYLLHRLIVFDQEDVDIASKVPQHLATGSAWHALFSGGGDSDGVKDFSPSEIALLKATRSAQIVNPNELDSILHPV
jgi:hypothetical protein